MRPGWIDVSSSHMVVLLSLRKDRTKMKPKSNISNMEASNVILVGGGHAHVQVLKSLQSQIERDKINVTVVDPERCAEYSGMLPGVVAGIYSPENNKIELQELASYVGATFVKDRVVFISKVEKKIRTSRGTEISFDILSIDIGSSTLASKSTPGVSENAISTRPIHDFHPSLLKREQVLVKKHPRSSSDTRLAHVVVVGSGAAGVELAFSLHARWKRLINLQVTLVSRDDAVLGGEAGPVCKMAKEMVKEQLAKRNISLQLRTSVEKVDRNMIHCRTGEGKLVLDCDVCIWATGAQGFEEVPKMSKDMGITEQNFIMVDKYLQVGGTQGIFGGGDCVHFESQPLPKAGVYAVRMGPTIAHNILATLKGRELEEFSPQREFLSLMCLGEGLAIGHKFGIAFLGKWVWALKDHIDRSFVSLFDTKNLRTDSDTKNHQHSRTNETEAEDQGDRQTSKQFNDASERTSDTGLTSIAAAEFLTKDPGKEVSHNTVDMALDILAKMQNDVQFRDEVVAIVLATWEQRVDGCVHIRESS